MNDILDFSSKNRLDSSLLEAYKELYDSYVDQNYKWEDSIRNVVAGKIEDYGNNLMTCLFYLHDNFPSALLDKKKYIGYLSGNTKLYNRFSTREMLKILANVYGMGKEETDKRIEFIEEVLEMGNFIDNRIEKLSTGQTQRANIARCLIHSPEIYIFDEPTLGLDVISSDAIVNFMKKEKEEGKTVLYSTHYMEEAQYLCDHIFMIYKGKRIAYGTPAQLMEETGTDNLRDTFKALIKKEGGSDE